MTTAPAVRPMTADELLALPDEPSVSHELVRGDLRVMSPTAALPGVVAIRLSVRLGGFVEAHALGVCGGADSGFRLRSDPDTVRAPDLWFVRAERVPADGVPNAYWPGAPDLAIEVLSPSDRFTDVMEKAQDYLDAGTRLVWVIDPAGRSAAIFHPDRRARLIGEDGVLAGEDVVPGFRVTLGELFP